MKQSEIPQRVAALRKELYRLSEKFESLARVSKNPDVESDLGWASAELREVYYRIEHRAPARAAGG